jgi:hypothetical protein
VNCLSQLTTVRSLVIRVRLRRMIPRDEKVLMFLVADPIDGRKEAATHSIKRTEGLLASISQSISLRLNKFPWQPIASFSTIWSKRTIILLSSPVPSKRLNVLTGHGQ